jgi:hypothetical protein
MHLHDKIPTEMTAFWHTTLCSLVKVDRRFKGAYCLHQGDDYPDDGDMSATSRLQCIIPQMAAIFIIAAART